MIILHIQYSENSSVIFLSFLPDNRFKNNMLKTNIYDKNVTDKIKNITKGLEFTSTVIRNRILNDLNLCQCDPQSYFEMM